MSSPRAHTQHAAMMRRPDKDFHSSASSFGTDELSAAKFQRHRKWILTRVARRRERQKEKRKSYGSFTQVEKKNKKKKLWIINCCVSTHFANSWDNENAYIQVSSLARGEIFSPFRRTWQISDYLRLVSTRSRTYGWSASAVIVPFLQRVHSLSCEACPYV